MNEQAERNAAQGTGDDKLMPTLFLKGFVCMVGKLFYWILDNVYCTSLQALKPLIGVYPNFYAYRWHILTGLATYFTMLAMLVHRRTAYGATSVPARG